MFPTSLCGVLVLLAGIPPASAGPSFRPPRPLLRRSFTHTPSSLTHSLTHSVTHSLHSLTHSLHSLTHSFTSLTHSLTHSPHSLTPLTPLTQSTHSLTHSFTHTHNTRSHHSLTHSITDSGSLRSVQRLQMVAAGPLALCSGRRSTQSLQKGLRRAWSPLGPSLFAVAGAVPRASRRDCGARGRRWAPCSPQCLETAEGPAARVVAAGPLALCSGRRSTQSLQKGLRRAWSPLGPSLFAVAGAVPRASRRDCGARGRRWAPCGSVRYCH